MNEQIVREIAIELAELKNEFDSRVSALHRKLKIALGDTKPPAKVTEFACRNGKVRTIKKQEGRK